MNTEIVKIREKKGKKCVSLYLDIYYHGTRKYEFLNLYLTANQPKQNALIRLQAEKRKNELIENILNGSYIVENKKDSVLLTDFVSEIANEKTPQTAKIFNKLQRHLLSFDNKKTLLSKVDTNYIKKFVAYLRQRVCENTVASYFARFKTVIYTAIRRGKINKNPFLTLENTDKPKLKDSKREYLTADEVKKFESLQTISDTETAIKQAFLFGCFTGLRISDIMALSYNDIEISNGKIRLKKQTKKTGAYISFELPQNAINKLDTAKIGTCENVFNLPPYVVFNEVKYFRKFEQRLTIKKHLSFHVARHTFATLLLTQGVDLYTVSKMLGHSNINTTQIYAKIIDLQKDKAAATLDYI